MRQISMALTLVLAPAIGGSVRAADAADAILDKAIKALGGEERLTRIRAASWTTRGTMTFMGDDVPITTHWVVQGLDHSRQEFEGNILGNPTKGVTVVAGDKGWRSFAGMKMEAGKEDLADLKRTVYLNVIPTTLVPLKSGEFKLETIAEGKVGGKPAAGIKVTPPDGKQFTLYFDKESGFPVKMVAQVSGLMGGVFTAETTFSNYRDIAGIRKATRISITRDGEKFIEQQVNDFKALDQVDPTTFAEPQ